MLRTPPTSPPMPLKTPLTAPLMPLTMPLKNPLEVNTDSVYLYTLGATS